MSDSNHYNIKNTKMENQNQNQAQEWLEVKVKQNQAQEWLEVKVNLGEWLRDQPPKQLIEAYLLAFGVPYLHGFNPLQLLMNLKSTKDAVTNLQNTISLQDDILENFLLSPA